MRIDRIVESFDREILRYTKQGGIETDRVHSRIRVRSTIGASPLGCVRNRVNFTRQCLAALGVAFLDQLRYTSDRIFNRLYAAYLYLYASIFVSIFVCLRLLFCVFLLTSSTYEVVRLEIPFSENKRSLERWYHDVWKRVSFPWQVTLCV